MIDSNTRIFSALDEYCARRDLPIANAGSRRWISTAGEDKSLLKDGKIVDYIVFSPARRCLRIDHGSDTYFCLIGFEYLPSIGGFVEIGLSGAILTLILAETLIIPQLSPAQVKNIVEYSDKDTDSEYNGHDVFAIADLFPMIHVLRASDIDIADTHRIFFMISLRECEGGGYWIDGELSRTLTELCELEISNIPYRMLCRSVFDADPGAMFLALYRCIEAIYSYSSAKKMINSLNIEMDWSKMAATLEDQLGWYAREATSLEELMVHIARKDAYDILSAMKEEIPTNGTNLFSFTAKKIYQLRNSLVHYRPVHQNMDLHSVDWNKLNNTLTYAIFQIYAEVFHKTQ